MFSATLPQPILPPHGQSLAAAAGAATVTGVQSGRRAGQFPARARFRPPPFWSSVAGQTAFTPVGACNPLGGISMANKVKEAWKAGKAVVNGWLAIPNAFSAEMYGQCGWDSVTVDMQHGVQDYLSCVACFQGIQPSGVTPMVRVPWNEPGIIGKVLDAGAYGVICPMINTPRGSRRPWCSTASTRRRARARNGPIRAGVYGEAGGYQKTANDEHPRHPDDRDQDGDREHRGDPRRPRHRRHLCRPVRPVLLLRPEPKLDVEDPFILGIYEKLLKETAKRGIAAGLHNG